MRRAWMIATVALVGCLIAILVRFRSVPAEYRAFQKYVSNPVPVSVANLEFHGSKEFGIIPYRPRYLSFTIGSNDFIRMVEQNSFTQDQTFSRRIEDQSNGVFYTRSTTNRSSLFGPRRRQNELLWLDDSGTNARYSFWRGEQIKSPTFW
jgi:hypothetical protein